jgi:uncharacterized protein (TIGR00369 family)
LDNPFFDHAPDPDHPGWHKWEMRDTRRFNQQAIGKLIVRRDDNGQARLRMFPTIAHTNLSDNVHGGALLALMDVSLFAGAAVYGVRSVGLAVTLDLSAQFIGAATCGAPIDAVVELLRETGRMIFLRGLVQQESATVAAFSGTVRKPSAPLA